MENHLLLSLFCLIILDSSKSHPAESSNKYYSFNMYHLNQSENDKYNSSLEDRLRNPKTRWDSYIDLWLCIYEFFLVTQFTVFEGYLNSKNSKQMLDLIKKLDATFLWKKNR